MINKFLQFVFCLLLFNSAFSQTNNLTSSPYSLFGLGVQNESNIGITNSLGKSGIALTSESELNGLNPASLASIKLNNFFFDVGLKGTYNSFGDKSSSSSMPSFGFSNISFGFPLNDKSGFSLSLIPFTEVGYFFQGLVETIDGSGETYLSNITGSGGLNNINVNYGRKLTKKLNIGISAKYLFGNIKQNEVVVLGQDMLTISDKNYYGGLNIEAGMQYQIIPKLNFSAVINFTSNISATKDRVVQKIISEVPASLENSKNINSNDYKIPTEITIGLEYDFKNYYFVGDYKKSFWNSIDQQDNIGRYVDSNVFGFGIERFTPVDFYKKRTNRYRIGYNFDDGNLKVLNKKIATSFVTAGIGIPLGSNKNSYLNISYSYGSKGVISNILVKEDFHSVTFNFDFADNWFVKRKYE